MAGRDACAPAKSEAAAEIRSPRPLHASLGPPLVLELFGRHRRVDDDVVGAQGRRGGALQVGERLVVVGLGLELLVARVGELVLALEEEELRRAPDLVEAAIAGELLLGALARLARVD